MDRTIVDWTTHKCIAGETFDSIALKRYGYETECSTLLQYNPRYISTVVFSGGEILKIPVYEDADVDAKVSPAPWR